MNIVSRALASCLLATLVPAAARAADPCLDCNVLYASDGPGQLWTLDPDAGTATLIGLSFPNFTDIGITTNSDLFGMSFDGDLYRISACDASATFHDPGYYGSGLTGDPSGPDNLFVTGPPLGRINTSTGGLVFIGGNTLGPPPLWCGPSSGDIAVRPADGLLYATLQCTCSGGDMFVLIDPTNGDVLSEVGCVTDSVTGLEYVIHGLAFDTQCRLWGSSTTIPGGIVLIDPQTALATFVPLAGGFEGASGLELLRCPTAPPCPATGGGERCEPHTQGFWKRQCRGSHPSGESERLDGYAPCVGSMATFAGVATANDVCDRLHPNPSRDKCEQAEAQFAALLLNACSGRLDRACCIEADTTSGTTVGAAISEIDALLANPARTFEDCVRAQAIADAINTGAALCDQ